MSFKIIKNSLGAVVCFGPNVPEYDPGIPEGCTLSVVDELPSLPLNDLIQRQLAQVNGKCEELMAQVKTGYPESEILSWSKQELEARAYLADNEVECPLITALAMSRNVPLATLAERIIEKADLFAGLSGQIIGTRQKLEDQLSALPEDATLEQLLAIQWPADPEEEPS